VIHRVPTKDLGIKSPAYYPWQLGTYDDGNYLASPDDLRVPPSANGGWLNETVAGRREGAAVSSFDIVVWLPRFAPAAFLGGLGNRSATSNTLELADDRIDIPLTSSNCGPWPMEMGHGRTE
jgi:hypothetical protein